MTLLTEIELAIRSRFPLIIVKTREEERLIDLVNQHCEKTSRVLWLWDHADFFQSPLENPGDPPPAAKDPLSVLDAIEKLTGSVVVFLKDFHQCWHNQPRVIRKLRNLAQRLKYTRTSVILSMPGVNLPIELNDEAVVLDLPSPNADELAMILDNLLRTPKVKCNLSPEARDRLLQAALGLSANQAQRVFAKAIVSDGVLDERDLALVNEEKKQIIRDSGALEFYHTQETTADVGGLEQLKAWLRLRQKALSPEAAAYGLPAPKGLALIGIPGTGKSLSAKMIAGLWKLPLIRLDIGALFGSLVGESEENTRKALHLAETVAPCILWIDELEKGLSGGQGGDGGTSMRVFGSILSWMQERRKPVFVVATANNISLLPPELLRRGRFDEIFFLDLPTAAERSEIFAVHLRKRKRDARNFDLKVLAQASEGFVGAEIEQAIIDAMFQAFSDPSAPGREVTTDDVRAAIARLIPLSKSASESIRWLRQWLVEGRAVSASSAEGSLRRTAVGAIPLEVEARTSRPPVRRVTDPET